MSPDHPSEERWEAFACGELSAGDRRELLAHAAGCPLCDKTARALGLLREEARFFDPGVPRKRSSAPWFAAGMMAALAAAMLLFIRPQPPAPETLRSGGRTGIAVRADAPPFAWDEVPGATEYVVRVYRENGELVWSGHATSLTISPPLDPGTYRWEVEALAGAAPLARSRLTRFSVGE